MKGVFLHHSAANVLFALARGMAFLEISQLLSMLWSRQLIHLQLSLVDAQLLVFS